MGEFLRPKAEVLPDDALVPEKNLVSAPDHFTHELTRPEPYYFSSGQTDPDGEFPKGTRLLLVHKKGGRCWVVNKQGRTVEIDCEGLSQL